ncbi:DNRLRE domain-containing protein [bacterium]|nr:DNRLRE domain-containing protein [bacterium]
MKRITLLLFIMMLALVQMSYANRVILTVSEIQTIRAPLGQNQILIKFNDLPEDFGETSRILKAELRLNLGFTPGERDEGVDIKIHRVNRAWNASYLSYSSFYSVDNAIDTTHYYLDYISTESDKIILDVSEYIKEWLIRGNNGVIIKTFTESADISILERMETRDIGSLELIYSPERR